MVRIVLFQPQIPPNTGNVARTCAATGSELHLVEPLGFEITDRQLKRAGLDYWPLVQLHRHPDLEAFLAERQRRGGRLLALTRHASQSYAEIHYDPQDWLLFGRESDGLPAELRHKADACLTIPMPASSTTEAGGVRSLNLSVAVGVVLYESLRQQGFSSRPGAEPPP